MKRFHEFDEWDDSYKKTWSYFFYNNFSIDFSFLRFSEDFVVEILTRIFMTLVSGVLLIIWYFIGLLF